MSQIALLEFLMSRKRKNATYRIDELVIEKVVEQAKKSGVSVNNWLESYLFNSFKAMGVISFDEIELGERRGGDRKSDKIKQNLEDEKND